MCMCVCVCWYNLTAIGLRFLRKAQLSQFSACLIAALIVFVDCDKESRYHLSIPPIYYELPFCLVLFTDVMSTLFGWWWWWEGGRLPVLMEFVVAVLVSSLSVQLRACFWNKKSIAVF